MAPPEIINFRYPATNEFPSVPNGLPMDGREILLWHFGGGNNKFLFFLERLPRIVAPLREGGLSDAFWGGGHHCICLRA